MTAVPARPLSARFAGPLAHWPRFLLVLFASATLWTGVSAAQSCVGDCDGNREVAVSELVLGVNIALGLQPVSACPAFANAQDMVDVAQLLGGVTDALHGCPPALTIVQPTEGILVLAGMVAAKIELPYGVEPMTLAAQLDGVDVTAQLAVTTGEASGDLAGIGAGQHMLTASASVSGMPLTTTVHFEALALANPDDCEVLNQIDCLLPYPSARFLVPDATTATGFHIHLPAVGMPVQNGAPLDPAPYDALDGFNPVGPIIMHFPGGVDVAASTAPRLSPATRTYDARSLDPDSPTVLLDADSGERILHFVELDATAADTPERQVLFLHPGTSLTPGHRYIIAVRHLVHPDGSPITPEPAFAALRDNRSTGIAAIESRRPDFERIFARLAQAGVERDTLLLAFDFVVQSDTSMTRDLLSMRDQVFSWLDEQESAGMQTFTVKTTQDFDCSIPSTFIGREITGTFEVPLFLTSDPVAAPGIPAPFNRGSNGLPAPAGITQPPFTFAIPCSALRDGGTALPVYVLGHGLADSGQGIIEELIGAANTDYPPANFPELIAAATDWTGFTLVDVIAYLPKILGDLNLEPLNVDRARQGIVNTLMLTRLVHQAAFNANPVFHAPSGRALLAGPGEETFFAGQSVGGGLGAIVGALSPDIERMVLFEPGSMTLFFDRSDEFPLIAGPTGISDPLDLALTFRLLGDQVARSDFSGYATHITSNPLPATNSKKVLLTLFLFDQEISNLNVELLARTLAIPSLEGSVEHALPLIPDRPGPLHSAVVIDDIGAADPNDPAQTPFIPPLVNLPTQCSLCDPHGISLAQVPTAAEQLAGFLTPGGVIENHCNGLCDGADPAERAYSSPSRCDPFHPWWVPYDFCS